MADRVTALASRRRMMAMAPFPAEKSGELVNFNSKLNWKLKNHIINLEPIQEGEGDPSPENIRPITGFTGIKVAHTGKNLFGGDVLAQAILDSCTSAAYRTGDIVTLPNGSTNVNSTMAGRVKMLENKFEPGQYTIIIKQHSDDRRRSLFTVFYTDGTSTSIIASYYNSSEKYWRFVTNANKTVNFIRMNRDESGKFQYDVSQSGVFKGSVEFADIEPYVGEIYNIEFPTEAGTVYGGTLNVKTGELIVDRELVTVSSNKILNRSKVYCAYKVGPIGYIDPSKGQYCNFLNWFEGAASSLPVGSFKVFDSPSYNIAQVILCFDGCRGSTISETKQLNAAKLQELEEAGTPMQVCFGLATPLTYHLTPIEITALLGQNNLWADEGATDVTYWTTI